MISAKPMIPAMSPVLEKIEREAFQLPAAERELLANHLFQSIHPNLTDVDEAWLTLADERFRAYKAGEEPVLTETGFFDAVEKELGWK